MFLGILNRFGIYRLLNVYYEYGTVSFENFSC